MNEQLKTEIDSLEVIPFCCSCEKIIRVNDMQIEITGEDKQYLLDLSNISHGYCSLCVEEQMDEIKKLKQALLKIPD